MIVVVFFSNSREKERVSFSFFSSSLGEEKREKEKKKNTFPVTTPMLPVIVSGCATILDAAIGM